MRNWAILTALIHQQTMMQSKVKCALLFFALTELKTFFRIFTHTVFQAAPPSALFRNEASQNQKWVTVCLFFSLYLGLAHRHTHARIHTCTRAHTRTHRGKKTEKPMFKALQFFFPLFLHFIPSFFQIMKNVGYETLDSQRSTQLSAILIQTQSDKMVTLSAH